MIVDPYEYLTIFISVVLGLAVVHLLSGVSLILDTRQREIGKGGRSCSPVMV